MNKLAELSEAGVEFVHQNEICDLLYHLKYTFIGDFLRRDAEASFSRYLTRTFPRHPTIQAESKNARAIEILHFPAVLFFFLYGGQQTSRRRHRQQIEHIGSPRRSALCLCLGSGRSIFLLSSGQPLSHCLRCRNSRNAVHAGNGNVEQQQQSDGHAVAVTDNHFRSATSGPLF